ncbi:MAG: hypothetical protein M3Y87_34310, partial [Myxococcota bacterium]|nr:hypothetical protein [Myxococcota bacterium]
MARGEPGKVRPQGAGLAIGSLFGAMCLAALTLVASTTDSCRGGCSGCAMRWMMPAPVFEPFAGASAAIDELSWRDVGRARPAYA